MARLYNLSFKRQIVSLRGISVLSVFFFHLNFEYFRNGYLGVDIFFLISGYVITQSLVKNWNGNKLDVILKFYVKRFNRIYPNLVFILVFVSLIFLLVIPFTHFLTNLNFFFYSLFGYSNIAYYLGGNDYFKDIDNPFLHTWSLGVETQIYVIFPLLFLLIFSFKKFKLDDTSLYLLIVTLFLSLFLFVYLYNKNYNLVFYFPIFRLWEFLLGSLIFFLDVRIKKNNFLANFSILIVLIILSVGDFRNFSFMKNQDF
jgi:peptidoglycan/LPS O-acetylase OafA/YrhL